MSALGIMNPAYSVSRSEILRWVNGLLDLKLAKIEDTASGAVACQVFHCIFPEGVVLSKVNFAARLPHEFTANYKVLQQAFDSIGIEKNIDVQKLIKAKYQDNLEFMQWVKAYFDSFFPDAPPEYDARDERKRATEAYRLT
eukprot:CAMPEP_0174901666 /NCGR_PEP_ID=MMETSP0167-20121228/35294_1 /TAXON_ID=38298 /ORGANISM="Rhodella maculata, Strain CCMP736" /LENGTH=140 /DNA_ID=CAMNT_0016143401 /DNA_START=46 /DNA_END=465 /DNA_ORIENTATION=+